MKKKLLALLLSLIFFSIHLSASSSLLLKSINSSNYEELNQMSKAFSLDYSLDENQIRENLIKYFNLDNQEPLITEESIKKASSITIENSDLLYNLEDALILAGNVEISFTSEENPEKKSLVAQKVIVDFQDKIIQALGSVVLEDSAQKDKKFEGSAIVLDWSNLDIVVFEGNNTSSRSNAKGKSVLFYASGQRISYAGDSNSIILHNGTIATASEDPLWSIDAQKILFAEKDVFIDNAIFKLGRVPIFVLPIFFYPGTTLSFNPAMGLSSSKGAFLNTTYEVFGKYPNLKVSGTKKDEDDFSASLTSFLSSEDDSEMIRNSLFYTPIDETELSKLDKWAKESSSYLAIMADIYEKQGLVLGLESKIQHSKFTLDAKVFSSYNNKPGDISLKKFRYLVDFNFTFKTSDVQINAKLPILSDPYVKVDLLNRNSAFTLDSLFGKEQEFPTTYTSQTTYSYSFDARFSKRLGNYSFNLSSLKADIDYRLDKDSNSYYKANITEASFPYLSFSSNGTFFNIRKENKKEEVIQTYSNSIANSFEEERLSLEQTSKAEKEESTNLSYQKGPEVKLASTSSSSTTTFSSGYDFYQTLDNVYKDQMERDKFYTKANASIYLKFNGLNNYLSLSQTFKPSFDYSDNDISKNEINRNSNITLLSNFEAKIPKLGITYTLNQNLYNFKSQERTNSYEENKKYFSWTKEDVTEHKISYSQRLNLFSLGLDLRLKPLVETIKPSVSFSSNGFRVNTSFSFEKNEETFEKGTGKLDFSYNISKFNISFANTYNFKANEIALSPWSGYTLDQSMSLKLVEGLLITENSSFEECFNLKTLKLNASYDLISEKIDLKTSASLTFKGKDVEKDTLDLKVSVNTEKLKLWKKRIQTDANANISFKYDFSNPFQSVLTTNLSFNFSIAEFVDLTLSFSSSNKSFYRYYDDKNNFLFSEMLDDLIKSFDFFGEGRKSTAFNLSSLKLQVVHYMRDWNLYIESEGKLTTLYSGKYEWVPEVKVYIKWNALPELKTEGSWNSYDKEWK